MIKATEAFLCNKSGPPKPPHQLDRPSLYGVPCLPWRADMIERSTAFYNLVDLSGRSVEFVQAELRARAGSVYDLSAFYSQFGMFPGEVI